MRILENQARRLLQAAGDDAAVKCNLHFLRKKLGRLHKNAELSKPSAKEMSSLWDAVKKHLDGGGVLVVAAEEASERVGEEVDTATEAAGSTEPARDVSAAKKPKKVRKPPGKKGDIPVKTLTDEDVAKAARKSKPDATRKAPRRNGMSDLKAAVSVLRESGGPMRITDIAAEIEERGLWVTEAVTPVYLTLKGHIYHHMKKKGKDSLFVKTEPGVITLRKGQ